MTDLVLNQRQNAENRKLTQDTSKATVGYLLPDGEWHFVPWLGFINRAVARSIRGARPVRLVNITRVDHGNDFSGLWGDVPQDKYVHGCLTDAGVYALYDTSIALVDAPQTPRSR